MTNKSDVMDRLAAARPASLDPVPGADRRAHDLAAAMEQPPTVTPHIRRRAAVRTARFTTLGFGLAAGVAAVALAVTSTGSGADSPRSTDVPMAAYPGTPPPGTTGELPVNARKMLLAAATKAENEPVGTGRYWYTKSRIFDLRTVGDKQGETYLVSNPARYEQWRARDARDSGWTLEQALGAKPATPADEAAWKRAGSPSTFTEATSDEVNPQFSATPGKPTVESVTQAKVDYGHPLTTQEAQSLPSDPGRLKAALRQYIVRANGADMGGDSDIFYCGVNLILDYPLAPKVRAATYRMLAGIRDVKTVGRVQDQTGRQGIAIAMLNGVDSENVESDLRLIVDSLTGRPLASELVVVKSGSGAARRFKPGMVTSSSVLLGVGWTNTPPSKP